MFRQECSLILSEQLPRSLAALGRTSPKELPKELKGEVPTETQPWGLRLQDCCTPCSGAVAAFTDFYLLLTSLINVR